jgi:hypothetical protein
MDAARDVEETHCITRRLNMHLALDSVRTIAILCA